MTTELSTDQAIALATDSGAFYRRQTPLMAVFAAAWVALAVGTPTIGLRVFDAMLAGFLTLAGVGSIALRARAGRLAALARSDQTTRWFVRDRQLVGRDAEGVPLALRITVPKRVRKQHGLPTMTAVEVAAPKSD